VAAIAAGLLVLAGAAVAADAVQTRRQEDRQAAEEETRRKQRGTRAESLVETVAAADPAGLPRVIEELADVRDLARPKLEELAERPIDTRPGLHARLALLPDDPGRAAEVAAYLPACRSEELLPV